MDISVSIVLYHNPVKEVLDLVDSIIDAPLDLHVILMDNSSDDSFRYRFNHPRVRYIYCGENIGYGSGHNLAIQMSMEKAKYHIVLNPDIVLAPEVLLDLYEFMEENREVGLVMPKIVYQNGSTQFLCKQLPSPADLILRRFIPGPVKRLFAKQLAKYELRDRDYEKPMEVPNLSGCFMFIRTEVFEKVGMFDERYFMYMEDTDLCRRIHKQYKTVYYPLSTIVHGYAKASYKNLKLTFQHIRSSILYFNKWGWFSDRERADLNANIRDIILQGTVSTHVNVHARTMTS